jgi:hypothetical protein
MSVISTGHSQVEHWLFGEISISADAEPPPLLRMGRPLSTASDPWECRLTSLFRFEGTALGRSWRCSQLSGRADRPVRAGPREINGDRSACRAAP